MCGTTLLSRPEILSWISLLDPGLRHSDIQERRVKNVGEWFIETEEFRRWRGLDGEVEDDKAILFCYGNPGVGKTFISSLIVDKLCEQTAEQHTAVTCFYFDFAARREQTATSMMGSILKQVIDGRENVPEDIWRALQKQKKAVSGRKLQLGDIVKILQQITSSQRTFMVIDALDESTAVQRFRLFDSLREILEKSPGARIFVTGRPHICPEIETRLSGRVTSISLCPARDDIVRFLRVRLSEYETPDAMDSSLEAEILEKIPGSISEMFLLASLNIGAILQESTIYRRRERLSKMTDGLGLEDIYGATIERIKAQGGDKSRLGMGALIWISYAEEPLGPDALCHALAIELGSTDFNASNIPSISTLVSCCQGLITVDKEASNVRLIHFTLKEYFSTHPNIFSSPHSTMAEICLTYLNSQQVKALSGNPLVHTNDLIDDLIDDLMDDLIDDGIDDHPFLPYCSLYWGVHTKKELSDHSRSLALQLLQDYDDHVSAQHLLRAEWYLLMWYSGTLIPFSGLHCASFLGIAGIVVALIDIGCCDPNGEDFQGYMPLAWASWKGHEEVVKILLGRKEVDPNKPDNDGRTPLSHAAERGHEGVVKMLLRREEVDSDKSDDWGRTPLLCAARDGRDEVVKILLGREDVSSDKPDDNGRTPLSHATKWGREKVVKMLLDRKEVNPVRPNSDGRTPLSYAAGYGHVGVVKILLGRAEVNPDEQCNNGRTPLSHAAFWGQEEVVKILLGQKEVDPDRPDSNGRTPLSYATEEGHVGGVKILLGREEVHPDTSDNNSGQTPLSYAAQRGHVELVKIILGRKEVNPDEPDNNGRTPLSHAAELGNEEVVKILLGREEVNPNKPDNDDATPLSHTLRNRRDGVIALLDQLEPAPTSRKRRRLNPAHPLSHLWL